MKGPSAWPKGSQLLPELEGPAHLVIITGCQRSGTSLLGQIIGAHPQALLLDEDEGLMEWANAMLAGEARQHRLYHRLLKASARKYRSPEGRVLPRTLGRAKLHPDVTHVVLKAPNLTYSHAQIARLAQPFSVVHPVRDPRAVVASMAALDIVDIATNQLRLLKAHPRRAAYYEHEIEMLEDEGTPLHVKRAIVWRIKSAAFERFKEVGIDPLVLRYEDMVAHAEDHARRIAAHIGLPYSEAMLNHAEVFQGSGPGRLERGRSIDQASREKWRDSLSAQEQEDILAIARPVEGLIDAAIAGETAPVPLRSGKGQSQATAPVIVTGRGGSGTRLISKVVQDCGVFLGNRLNRSADSLEWVDIIQEIAVRSLRGEADGDGVEALRRQGTAVLAKAGLGGDVPWGFKVPEAMLATQQLLEAFPDAKLVHLVRHPVTSSLRRSHLTSRPDNPVGRAVCEAAYAEQGRKAWRIAHDPVWLRNAITWNYQVGPVAKLGRELGPERYLEIRFEDLCDHAEPTMARVSDFLGSDWTPGVQIDQKRAPPMPRFSLRKRRIWRICGEVASQLGYEPI